MQDEQGIWRDPNEAKYVARAGLHSSSSYGLSASVPSQIPVLKTL